MRGGLCSSDLLSEIQHVPLHRCEGLRLSFDSCLHNAGPFTCETMCHMAPLALHLALLPLSDYR